MSEKYDVISCNFDMIPAAEIILNATEQQAKKFNFEIIQDITNPSNDDMKISYYRENIFKERLFSIKKAEKQLGVDAKYIPYLKDLISKFDTFNFTDIYIRESQNELWVIADYVDSDISNSFFSKAFEIWRNIFIDVDVLFIGENELTREFIPDDVIQVPVFVGV